MTDVATKSDLRRALAVQTVAVGLMLALVVVQGRLVYPIVGITIDDPNLAVLLVAIFEGGLHLVFLMLSLCGALLAFSLRQNRYALIAGILSSVAFIVASYPDQAGYLVARVAGATGFLAFFFCAGAGLYRADVRQNA